MTTTVVPRSGQASGSWPAYGAALWSLLFALAHIVWAMGWYIGLREESARQAFQRTSFLVYDLIVAGLCVVAVFVALALVQSWGRRLPRHLLLLLGWGAAGLLGLRGVAGVIQGAYLLVVRPEAVGWMGLYDPWFCLGGALFGVSMWRFARHDDESCYDCHHVLGGSGQER
jgi:hypothetical protein